MSVVRATGWFSVAGGAAWVDGPSAIPLAPATLPRADALTDLLLGTGGGGPARVDADGLAAVSARLERGLASVVRPTRAHVQRCVRIGGYQLAASQRSAAGAPETPFRWTARAARRTVGLAALREVLRGRIATPADAAARVVSRPERFLGGSTPGPGSCAEWLGSLPAPARAAAEAEATTWATNVWSALDWERFDPAPRVGIADRWWGWAGPVRVALRGRADLRVDVREERSASLPGSETRRAAAHLLVVAGSPTPSSRASLGLSALVDALLRGPEVAPERVVGWWPECGKAWAVDVDVSALGSVVDAVVTAVRDRVRPEACEHAPRRLAQAGTPR